MASIFNGIRVFSATMMADRERLGERLSEWLAAQRRDRPGFELVEIVTTQSSDHAFHCVALTCFYKEPIQTSKRVPVIDMVTNIDGTPRGA